MSTSTPSWEPLLYSLKSPGYVTGRTSSFLLAACLVTNVYSSCMLQDVLGDVRVENAFLKYRFESGEGYSHSTFLAFFKNLLKHSSAVNRQCKTPLVKYLHQAKSTFALKYDFCLVKLQ